MEQTWDGVRLPRATCPEEAGVSTAELTAFVRDLEESHIANHSFMVLRHGMVAAEAFVPPFAPEIPHALYSFSKSVSATAVGFAIDEGLISLDTLVKDVFPEYKQKHSDENYQKLTVRHLMTMTSGREPNLIADKAKIDWIQDFIDAPVRSMPGEQFRYTNENIYMLCAIVSRVSGMSVVDYLMPRLFEPLHIDRPFWETDQKGIEAGGWGLYLKTEDMAKFILCYLNKGVYNGRQVIPAWFAEDAIKPLVDNRNNEVEQNDSSNGYGYCFWHNYHVKNCSRADGMFSQFGILLPDYDAAVILTDGHPDEQYVRDCIWRHFPKVFEQVPDAPTAEDTAAYQQLIASRRIPPLPRRQHSPLEAKMNGRRMRFPKTALLNILGYPMGMLPLPVTFMTTDKAGNIDNMAILFNGDTCQVIWSEGDEMNCIPCGMDGKYRRGSMRLGGIDYETLSSAAWKNEVQLEMEIRPIQTVASRKLLFTFNWEKGTVVLKPGGTPDIAELAMSLAPALDTLIKNEPVNRLLKTVINHAGDLIEPTLTGRILK